MLKSETVELEIEMTTLCNAQCPLCYRNYKTFEQSCYNKATIRPLDDIVNQLDQYENLNFVMLVGSMSEPTLYPEFIPLVAYLKKRNIKIEICTNGDTRDDDFWKQLGEILDERDLVYFTICGSTQQMHERYRIGTRLEKILNSARTLRKNGKMNDYAQCIRFNYNSDDLDSEKFRDMANEFSHVYMTETFYPKDVSTYKRKFNLVDFVPNRHKISKYDMLKKLAEVGYNTLKNDKAVCQSMQFKRQQIDVFGNAYPCYLFLESMNGKAWDQDYAKIVDMQYECCKFCSKFTRDYCKKNELDYII